MNRPALSIILPFYNRNSFLREAIVSIINQDFKDIEIIAVDDGSTDGSAEIIAEFSQNNIHLIVQENRGAASARNAGIHAASGKFITFLDSDDIWTPNKLSAQLKAFNHLSDKTMHFGHIQEFISPEFIESKDSFKARHMPGYSLITLFMLRTEFLRIGEFDVSYKLAEFVEWFQRAKNMGYSTQLAADIYAFRRIHQGNVGRKISSNAFQYLHALKSSLDQRRKLGE